jgi:probable HAF family extracellular repeat protein
MRTFACRGARRGGAVVAAVLLAASPFALNSAKAAHPTFSATHLHGASTEATSYATGMNEAGQVIVNFQDNNGDSRTTRWSSSEGLVDVGNLGFNVLVGRDINESGQIVGVSQFSSSDPNARAFSWTQGGGIVDLGALGGASSDAQAVNDSGAVVGLASTPTETHAFLWTAGGGMVDLGSPGQNTFATDINNAGMVAIDNITTGHAFVWTSGGGMVDIGTLGGVTRAVRLSENGAVVGQSFLPSGDSHPFMWTSSTGMIDLGSLGGSFAEATDVNESGEVVGRATTTGDEDDVSFFWSESSGIVLIDGLQGNETEARGINASGQVVGYTSAPGSNALHGFLWTEADGFIDLGIEWAEDINDAGQISGTEVLPGPITHAVFLEPVVSPDGNGNGIDDVLEVPGQPAAFNDGNSPVPTSGSIVNANGHTVRVAEAAAPDGVRVTVTGAGTTKATISVCGMTLQLAPGADVIATCGSLTITVIAGEATVVVGGGRVVVTVPSGAKAKVTDLGAGSYRVDNVGTAGAVTVSLDGTPSSVAPGQTRTVSTGDTTPPTVVCAAAPRFIIGQTGATVSATVSDTGSGPLATPVSAAANTSQVGTFSANVTGRDVAGNAKTVACSYSVVYRVQFLLPLNGLDFSRSVARNTVVPFTFRVVNAGGNPVLGAVVSATTSVATPCPSGTPPIALSVPGNASTTNLTQGWWLASWKAETSMKNTCRLVSIRLNDGLSRTVLIKVV